MSYLYNTRSLHICSKRVTAITPVWYRIPTFKLPVAYLLSFTKWALCSRILRKWWPLCPRYIISSLCSNLTHQGPPPSRADALASLPASFLGVCGFCFVLCMLWVQALHLLKCSRSWPGSLLYVVEVVFCFTHIFLDTEDTKKKSYPLPLRNSSLRHETHKKKTVQSGKYHNGSFQKETKYFRERNHSSEGFMWKVIHVWSGESWKQENQRTGQDVSIIQTREFIPEGGAYVSHLRIGQVLYSVFPVRSQEEWEGRSCLTGCRTGQTISWWGSSGRILILDWQRRSSL